jgi:hypothetical protein
MVCAGARHAEEPPVRQLAEVALFGGGSEVLVIDAQDVLVSGEPAQPEVFGLGSVVDVAGPREGCL